MAYPDTFYRQRLAAGEEIAGKNLLNKEDNNRKQASYMQKAIYWLVGIMMSLVIARIVLRINGMQDIPISKVVHALTDPYVWVFNSLFSGTPNLTVTAVEPGALVLIALFPLLGWAVLGLFNEILSSNVRRTYLVSKRTKHLND